MRKIIVDIDNTLWDLAPVLYEHIRAVTPTVPLPAEWYQWDFWKGYISEKAVYGMLRDIHMHQDEFGVYPDAAKFLTDLRKKGFYIIIASHREKGTINATEEWLKKHQLPLTKCILAMINRCFLVTAGPLLMTAPRPLIRQRKQELSGQA